jgi:hypothetical protein
MNAPPVQYCVGTSSTMTASCEVACGHDVMFDSLTHPDEDRRRAITFGLLQLA